MLERETLKWFKPAKGQFQTGARKPLPIRTAEQPPPFPCVFRYSG